MAKKKRNRPSDPAEIARRRRDREAYTRATPSEWGLNEDAQRLPQNASIQRTEATRERTARIQRYDCFALLHVRGALADDRDASTLRLAAVRRLEEMLATRYRLEALPPSGAGGVGLPHSHRSLEAAESFDLLAQHIGALSLTLLIRLLEPSVFEGQPVNNWRAVVARVTGEHRHVVQASLVRAAAQNLAEAWVVFDNRTRRAA